MRFLLALLLAAGAGTAVAADWKPAATPLMTKWGKQVTAEKQPWPEYPRPQLVRDQWLNLNGLWDYAITPRAAPRPEKWDGQILVPFCAESALSGVGRRVTPDQHLWYKRSVEVPAGWAGKRVLLHFGAVDWEATVFVNGKELVTHRGGSDPFTIDITDALRPGANEIVVRVWDPTDTGAQPRGKQVMSPEGIWYTPVTGIWQTVWLEPVFPHMHVRRVRFTPDIDRGEVEVIVEIDDPHPSVWATVEGPGMKGETIQTGAKYRLKVPDAKLWTPDTPHLYPATIVLSKNLPGGARITNGDRVSTYFAMRKVSAGKDANGVLRLMLNNRPLFQYGPLDQGWWPDGLLTPPSDEAMRYDVDVLKRMGFNMLRKHIKVEPARFYHHCDKVGMLVWQDMPSGGVPKRGQLIGPDAKQDATFTPAEKAQFRTELKAMIDHLRVFPSIYCWVPFNEGWGQHDTNDVLKWTKEYDPSRLTNGPSGWADRGFGDMKDAHIYPGPGMFPVMPDRVSVLGEFGGLGLPVAGRLWKDKGNWGYRTYKTREELRDNYQRLAVALRPLVARGLAAAVYTQTTDVEVEVNGLMTYDREVIKFDVAELAGWHRPLYGPPPTITELVPTSEKAAQTWRYTTTRPAAGWEKADFDAAAWSEGPGGFGTKGTPGGVIRTEWKTNDVWLRRTAELKAAPAGEAMLRLHHDEDAEVFINGVLAARVTGFTTAYVEVPLTAAGRAALRPGRNVIAIHCRQTGGGQYIDAGLVEVK
ncbi:glycoside hydrolase family 2 protein [Urbifossiella limnaea]|uniref:Beta-glucuronidase n=1 Tax=Urbifossiella limnaea TaxID=2528023 RepID=A0A517Y3L5_9BACT|nr:sugar-binding domain-containing protein [Urbifossiella limnaea]QDU24312.1 Beta-glucuronidase [Urbifossiella limnaea]